MESTIVAMQPPLYIKLIVIGALCAWSALLSHKSIANFHDGLRPVFPEFLEGRMSRAELASIAFAISVGFVIGFGVPFTIATGIILIYLLLLPTDVIGVGSPNMWIAMGLGAVWGALIVGGVESIQSVIAMLPVDFMTPLAGLAAPLLPIFSAFPALATAYQFGAVPGIVSLSLTLIARQAVALIGTIQIGSAQFNIDPTSIGIFTGMVVLLVYAMRQKTDNTGGEKFFTSKVQRIRKHLPYLMVQGALLALASRLWIFAGSEVDILPLAQHQLSAAAAADIARGFGFVPLIATTALATGVYQAVGFTFVYPAGFLMPYWWMAPFAGAAVMAIEVLALGKVGEFLDRYPALRESADHLRGSITRVLEVALLIGSAMAADQILPGGLGFVAVGGLYILNEAAGQKVSRVAAAPIAAILVGILANILSVLGMI